MRQLPMMSPRFFTPYSMFFDTIFKNPAFLQQNTKSVFLTKGDDAWFGYRTRRKAKMSKFQCIAFTGAFLITASLAILWHVVLFEQQFLNLGVFTRMDAPHYGFGMAAWVLESCAIVWIFSRMNGWDQSVWGAVTLAWLVGAFAAASSLFGVAAKVRIDDLTQWFLLTGGFIFLHTSALGLWLGLVAKRYRARRRI